MNELKTFDDDGNIICNECFAHINPNKSDKHICPEWMKLLVKRQKYERVKKIY